MIRKSVFWGLTVVLVAVLVSLIVRSRSIEKQSTPKVTEVVKTAQSSPIRILAPQDLKVVKSDLKFVELAPQSAPNANAPSMPELEVSLENRGPAPYVGVQMHITFLGTRQNILGSRNYLAEQVLPPGQTTSIGNIKLDDVPKKAAKCEVTIISADFEP